MDEQKAWGLWMIWRNISDDIYMYIYMYLHMYMYICMHICHRYIFKSMRVILFLLYSHVVGSPSLVTCVFYTIFYFSFLYIHVYIYIHALSTARRRLAILQRGVDCKWRLMTTRSAVIFHGFDAVIRRERLWEWR